MFGRERELDELACLLADPDVPLLTLTGTGGTGKTTLALAATRRAGAGFMDGVTVVWLAAVSDEWQVVLEVARSLSVELSAQEDALQTVIRALRPQHRLLVLDNFEHVIGAAPAMAWLVSECPHLRVVVTSRAPLRVSFERAYRVSGLADSSNRRCMLP